MHKIVIYEDVSCDYGLKKLLVFIGILYIVCMLSVSSLYSEEKSSFILSNTVKNITISIEEMYAWRDWQPIVTRAGKDNGSPLKVKTSFLIENANDITVKIHWEAYLQRINDGKIFPLELLDSDSALPWTGTINARERKKVGLRTYSGPYLKPDTLISLRINFIVDGELLQIKSKPVSIEATH